MVKSRTVEEINASLQSKEEPPKVEQKQEPKQPKTDYKAKAHELTHKIVQLELEIKQSKNKTFTDGELTDINDSLHNWINGWSNKAKSSPKVKRTLERIQLLITKTESK